MDGVESGWMNERADLWKEWMEGIDGKNGWWMLYAWSDGKKEESDRRRKWWTWIREDEELPGSHLNNRTGTVCNGVKGRDAVNEECLHSQRTLFPQE